jgi:geranylgeranyl pyrophosphate synthase
LIDYNHYFESYISKTYFKTASMISLGCRGLGLIFDLDLENQRRLFNFGAHLGIAFQIHDDILDFTQDSTVLGKPAFNDVKEGIITAPLIYGLLDIYGKGDLEKFQNFNRIVLSKFENKN